MPYSLFDNPFAVLGLANTASAQQASDRVRQIGTPEADAAVRSLIVPLSERPRAAGLDAAAIAARLAGRPAGDLAWVVEEAARLAVRSGKDAIDEICLASAVRNLS